MTDLSPAAVFGIYAVWYVVSRLGFIYLLIRAERSKPGFLRDSANDIGCVSFAALIPTLPELGIAFLVGVVLPVGGTIYGFTAGYNRAIKALESVAHREVAPSNKLYDAYRKFLRLWHGR